MARSALMPQALSVIRILLVEDADSDAFVVESLLRDGRTASYQTYCVKSQAEALMALRNQSFDVCLLDLTLPDASGFSALIDIQDKAPDMPVLILTGVNDMALAKIAVARGAQDYLLKDEIDITGLSRAIDYAIERKRAEKELFLRASCDALTGLANRESFLSRLRLTLSRARRSGMGVAVLFIDLDHFKSINDIYGHEAGDEVLRTVANRIRVALRAYDTPARMGGDEFVVLLEGIGSPRDAGHIARKLVAELSIPISYQGYFLDAGASVGVAFSDVPMDAEELLQHADTAMYHAKKGGGKAYRFYSDSMHEEILARLSLEEDLRTAIAGEQLRLYYQPYVNQDGEAMVGVEAFLRWVHPERGLLCAQEFLVAAEAARLMPEIGKWKCEQLKRDIAFWNTQALLPISIALNFSVSQLDSPDLMEWITPLTQRDFMGQNLLAVEIPEGAIAPISSSRLMKLARLHEMGVGLHLDHFGVGSFPLTTLCALPFSLLKIDMSLIKKMSKDVSENVLINIAIMLAHHLGMKAGAVGIETPWQAAALKAQSCDTMQGYLTTRPMTAEQLVAFLKK